MSRLIIKQSSDVTNPLEEDGIICINRNNTKKENINNRLKELDNQGYIIKRIYCYEHGGRVFSPTLTNGCNFDNYIYGVFAIPKDFNLSEENIKNIYETYTLWSEGEVYDYIVIDDPNYELDSRNIFDCFLEKIDYQELYENNSEEILNYIKENKIKKSSIEDINIDDRFDNFKKLYFGKTKQGLISYKEIKEMEWNYEIFGISQIEEEIKEGI